MFNAPLDAPEMREFADALDRINAIADASPGFVWRLEDDDGGPSSNVEVPGATDPLPASNLSVWTDLESLWGFMYRTDHAAYLRRRVEWFRKEATPMTVAWWIPAGQTPTLEDALRRLDHLREHGPSDTGFPLGRRIPAPPSDSLADPRPLPEETPMSQTLIPYLTVGDSHRALDLYAEVFGAERRGELFEMDDGRIGHAEMTIDGQIFHLADAFSEMNLRSPGELGANSVSIVINVDDCDAVYAHAIADPWGHRWAPTGAEI